MKILSDNLLVLVLAIVLGLSPLQSIYASVSKCMNVNQSMHHQMMNSDKMMQHDMMQSEPLHDCCEQTACDMSHCASTVAAVITSDSLNEMTYTVSNVVLKPNDTLIQFFPSSLYRPPKI